MRKYTCDCALMGFCFHYCVEVRLRRCSYISLSHVQLVEFVFDIWWVLLTASLGHIAMQLPRAHFFWLFSSDEHLGCVRPCACVVVMIVLVFLANHQSPFSECTTLFATTTAFFPVAMMIPTIKGIHSGVCSLALGNDKGFKDICYTEAAFWFSLAAATVYKEVVADA